MKLSDILEDYIKMLSIYEETPITPSGELIEGGVYRLPGKEPLFVVAVNREGSFVEVAPLSFCWPLATRLDLIVSLPHPLSDTWIVQTDLAVSVPEKLLQKAELIGRLKEEDLKILKRTLEGELPLPEERRGRGYGDPVHERFKELEYRRYRFLIDELLRAIEQEESYQELRLPDSVRELLEESALLSPAAYSTEGAVEIDGATLIPLEEGVEVVIDSNLVGKRGKIGVETPEGEVLLFEGELPEVLTIKNIGEKTLNLLSRFRLEVES